MTPLAQLWQQTGQKHELYLNQNCDPDWRQSEQTLRSLSGMTEPALAEIKLALAKLGLRLKQEEVPQK